MLLARKKRPRDSLSTRELQHNLIERLKIIRWLDTKETYPHWNGKTMIAWNFEPWQTLSIMSRLLKTPYKLQPGRPQDLKYTWQESQTMLDGRVGKVSKEKARLHINLQSCIGTLLPKCAPNTTSPGVSPGGRSFWKHLATLICTISGDSHILGKDNPPADPSGSHWSALDPVRHMPK